MEETTKAQAEAMGALAFFGDKYGERVRVVRAGPHSIELCGGTHVGALGMIGPITVVSEASIGSNTRRIEAVTGTSAFDRIVAREGLLAEAAALLRTEPEHVARGHRAAARAPAGGGEVPRAGPEPRAAGRGRPRWPATAVDGVVVARRDGLDARPAPRPGPGRPDHGRPPGRWSSGAARTGPRPSVAVAADRRAPDDRRQCTPASWSSRSPPCSGGGGGGSPEMAVAGGKDPGGIDRALDEAASLLAAG